MTAFGADVNQLEELTRSLNRSSDALRQMAHDVGVTYAGEVWRGRDAERARADWGSALRPQPMAVAQALAECGESLRRNAQEQREASGSGTGSISGGASDWRLAASVHPDHSFESPTIAPDDLRPRDFLAFADAAYRDDAPLPAGWTEIGAAELKKLGLRPGDLNSEHGLDARILMDADGNYVLAFAGSSLDNNGVDWLRENARSAGGSGAFGIVGQAINNASSIIDPGTSTEEAMALAYMLKNAVGEDRMTLVGHSLGGRHAAAASVLTGAKAVTFNAAGVTDGDIVYAKTILGDDVSVGSWLLSHVGARGPLRDGIKTDQITNYALRGDPLSIAQGATPAYSALGKRVTVDGSGHDLRDFEFGLGPGGGGTLSGR